MTTKDEAEKALAYLEEQTRYLSSVHPACFDVIRARLAELEAALERKTTLLDAAVQGLDRQQVRLAELEAKNQHLLDELSDKACPKCDGVNGVWAEGGKWVKCPRCGVA